MKKLIYIIALSGLFAASVFAQTTPPSETSGSPAEPEQTSRPTWLRGIGINASIGFESEYVFRGRNLTHSNLVTSLEGSYKLYNGSLYVGVLNHTGLANNFNESDFYAGYRIPFYDKLSLDLGYTYYWYTQKSKNHLNTAFAPGASHSNEVYLGLAYKGFYVNPALYAYYNFDLDEWVGELSGKYRWDMARYGLAKTSLDVGAFVGVLSAGDANAQLAGGPNNGYWYYGATADLVYAINDMTSASVGMRYAGNADGANSGNDTFDRENNLWWGARLSAGF